MHVFYLADLARELQIDPKTVRGWFRGLYGGTLESGAPFRARGLPPVVYATRWAFSVTDRSPVEALILERRHMDA